MMLILGLVLLVAWPVYNVVLVVCAFCGEHAGRRPRRADAMAPTWDQPELFWLVVPCLNEERVVGRTVLAALALTGPPGTRTAVLAVDDGSDDATPGVLAAIDHPNLRVLRRNLPNARRGKGEALNAAYRFIRAEVAAAGIDPHRVAVGVIDGDGRASPNMLTEVWRAMRDPRVGAVQCRVRIHNRDRLLAAVQDLEFGCVADASQLLRNRLGTVGLGGNGQFTRLSTLDSLGPAPWSGCLVEDLELGLRMHLAGERIRYASRATVTQQGLVDVRRLLRQRTRWAQGNLQCASHVPRLVASPRIRNHALLDIAYSLLAPWFNAFGVVAVTALWAYAAWRLLPGQHPTALVASWSQLAGALGVWAAAVTAPGLVWAAMHRWRLRAEDRSRWLLAGLAYPGFLLLGLVSTWRALGRHAVGRQSWAKTERLVEEPPGTTALEPAALAGRA